MTNTVSLKDGFFEGVGWMVAAAALGAVIIPSICGTPWLSSNGLHGALWTWFAFCFGWEARTWGKS